MTAHCQRCGVAIARRGYDPNRLGMRVAPAIEGPLLRQGSGAFDGVCLACVLAHNRQSQFSRSVITTVLVLGLAAGAAVHRVEIAATLRQTVAQLRAIPQAVLMAEADGDAQAEGFAGYARQVAGRQRLTTLPASADRGLAEGGGFDPTAPLGQSVGDAVSGGDASAMLARGLCRVASALPRASACTQ